MVIGQKYLNLSNDNLFYRLHALHFYMRPDLCEVRSFQVKVLKKIFSPQILHKFSYLPTVENLLRINHVAFIYKDRSQVPVKTNLRVWKKNIIKLAFY